jgi:hypothetical protein
MAEAINYALSLWQQLSVFSSDGAVPIDNNISEREMKRGVLNRKNSLFVGNARGGRTAAILASLTSTCRRHDITRSFTSPNCSSTYLPCPLANSPRGSLINGKCIGQPCTLTSKHRHFTNLCFSQRSRQFTVM